MNNYELESVLKDLPIKVCCAEELPAKVIKRPYSFVTNTDSCGRPGSHWVVFHFPEDGPCEFFDSLGVKPELYHSRFKNVLVTNGPSYF